MNASLLPEAVDLVDEAAALPPSARDAFYTRRCHRQPELLALVRRIEAAPDDSRAPTLGDSLEELTPLLFADQDEGAPDPLIGMLVDEYRIEEEIGCGGMGRVYRALYTRHHAVVALKVLQTAGTADSHARLKREVELLERCNHPAIVRARHSGVLPDGRSYFTMDLVEGQPSTAYCASINATLAQRLCLLIHVCEGVQAAHAVGVIHRDLKPSNILVTGAAAKPTANPANAAEPPVEVSVEPSVRLLDFGIAEAFGDTDLTVRSYIAVAYAAPEHTEATSPETDVYSLGILLAELVLARLPFDLTERRPSAMRDAIIAQGIQPLRTFVAPDQQPWLAGLPLLRWRELDAIYRRATALKPGDRYATVKELARDLEAFLARRSVHALHLSPRRRALYETCRLVSRNRLPTATIALLLLLLTGAVASYTWGLRQSRNAALQATAQAVAHADEMQDLAAGLFLDGAGALSASSTVEDVIDRGVRTAQALNSESEEQAKFLTILGQAYQGLGRFSKAEGVFQRVLALRVRLNGADSAQAADVLGRQADVLDRESRWKEAMALGQRAFAIEQRTLPPGSKDLLETEELLAEFWNHVGNYKKSATLLEDVIRLETGKPDMLYDLSRAQSDLASVDNKLGHPEQSLSLVQQATAINRRLLGSRNVDVGINLINLSGFHTQLAQYPQAEAEARESLAILKEKLPPGDDNIAYAKNNLGIALLHQARWSEAQSALEASLHEMRAEPAPSRLEEVTVLWGLGTVYQGQGKLPLALSTFQSSLAGYKRLYPEPNFYWTAPLLGIASVFLKQRNFAAAEQAARQAYDICRAQLPPASPKTIASQILLGRALTAQHRYPEAEPLLHEAARLANAGGQPTAELRPKATQSLLELQTALSRSSRRKAL